MLKSIVDSLLTSPRSVKRSVTMLVDLLCVISSLWLAFSLRYGEIYLPAQSHWWVFLLAPAVALPVYVQFGLYRSIIRHLGMHAVWSVVKAVSVYTLIFSLIVLLSGIEGVPRTAYGIQAIILIFISGGLRLLARAWITKINFGLGTLSLMKRRPTPLIVYGAGESGIQLLAAFKQSNQYTTVAFIDDNPDLHFQLINGITVYPFSHLNFVINKFDVADLLLAMPSESRNRRSEIIRLIEPYPLHVKTLPNFTALADGSIKVSDIQEVDIGDLLGRDPVAPINELLHANIKNKNVMITGAGGSIGSELCRQVIRLNPRILVLYELNEFSLYTIEKELLKLNREIEVIALLGSVTDQNRVEKVIEKFSIHTIYHAAAYKHVPMVEKNITQGVENNIFGTLNTAMAAIHHQVETFVLISTDKAVRPTNVMGATKRYAELVLQALSINKEINTSTRFTMVRFGNVLGSSGSVVPLFREQIANGGPVTVTDERIIRFFMTIPEAAELVVQAGALGQGGDVFVLDMGEPVKIIELAKRMIHLSGLSIRDEYNPEGDIEIEITGLRPGEKLYEELLIGENVTDTEHKKIMRAEEEVISWEKLNEFLEQIRLAIDTSSTTKLRQLLINFLPDFKPQASHKDLLE